MICVWDVYLLVCFYLFTYSVIEGEYVDWEHEENQEGSDHLFFIFAFLLASDFSNP